MVISTYGPQPERTVRSAPDVPVPIPDRAVYTVADSVRATHRADREADASTLAYYESCLDRPHVRRRIEAPVTTRAEPAPADDARVLDLQSRLVQQEILVEGLHALLGAQAQALFTAHFRAAALESLLRLHGVPAPDLVLPPPAHAPPPARTEEAAQPSGLDLQTALENANREVARCRRNLERAGRPPWVPPAGEPRRIAELLTAPANGTPRGAAANATARSAGEPRRAVEDLALPEAESPRGAAADAAPLPADGSTTRAPPRPAARTVLARAPPPTSAALLQPQPSPLPPPQHMRTIISTDLCLLNLPRPASGPPHRDQPGDSTLPPPGSSRQ